MGRRSIVAGFALLACSALAPSAHAQKAVLDVPATKKWQHARTGLIVPQAPAGLPRTEILTLGQGELDIAVQFGDVNKTQATLYLFRPALMSVPVWFDRVETQILQRGAYGNPTPATAPIGFATPGGTAPSALRRFYKPSKPPYAATGAAVLPLGEWLVVVRISSVEQDPAQLDATLSALIAGLGWPARAATVAEAPAAVPVQPCAAALAFDKKAKMQKPDMAAGLFGSLLAVVAADKSKETAKAGETSEARPLFCRDPASRQEQGVYRVESQEPDSYTIAIADAGRTVFVYRELALDPKKKPGFAVTLNTLDRAYSFPAFDRLPDPEKVMQAIAQTQPVSSVERGSKTISIRAR